METLPKKADYLKTYTGCVRTIVVWKHTYNTEKTSRIFSCVRTIVVWKRYKSRYIFIISELRENHSGMETIIKLHKFRIASVA